MKDDQPKPRPEFLDIARRCGATLTGKPDGSEAITVVFSITAWRAFDRAILAEHEDMNELHAYAANLAGEDIWESMQEDGNPTSPPRCCSCGTTIGLRPDGGYGYRCESDDCLPY